MASRPLETTRLMRGRCPHNLIQCKFAEPSKALPNFIKVKKVEHFSFEPNRVSELVTSLGREFLIFGP